MKKAICLFLCVVLCLCLMPVSYAEEWARYNVPDLGMTIDFPGTFLIWDLDTTQDDPVFKSLFLEYENAMDALRASNGLLDGVSTDFSTEIMIRGIDSPVVSDLSLLQEDLLDFRISLRKDQLEANGDDVVVTSHELFSHPQATFIKYYYEQKIDDSTTHYGTEYYTVCKNKEVAIDITSYTGELSETQDRLMDHIVSNVAFHEVAQETKLFGTTYKDEKTGVRFMVPREFTEIELTEAQKQGTTAAFNSMNGEIITYSTMDAYNTLSPLERARKMRSQMRFDDLTQRDIDDFFTSTGVSKDQVTKVQKGNIEYYEAYTNLSNDTVSFKTRIDLTMLNGYMIAFMDMALQDSDDSALAQLLSSVKTLDAPVALGETDEFRKLMEDVLDSMPIEKDDAQDNSAELREHLLSLYNVGAEGKNPLGDYFYYIYNKDEGNNALLVILSADRENYDSWEGTTEAVGDHLVLTCDDQEVPFYFGDVDDNGIFNMTFVNDGDVATMHYLDIDIVADDIVASRLEFVN